tara:strand:+ start:648 stop:956 length:309 start_codon:yes stop_codon:yes gene_type:complete
MIYKITLLLIASLLIGNCSNVKKTLSGEKEKNYDEFLIEKKNPLVVPPEFSKLPQPRQVTESEEIEDTEIDLSKVLEKSDSPKISTQTTDLEKSIFDIINKK